MNNLISVFNKAIEYIEEKIKNSEEITNKDIAEICGYEQHYCSKIFRKYANMNIQEYVKKRKMTFAFIDLIKSEENISDIAEKYLYSADGFTKAFKDTFGITPIQLKRKEKTETLIDNFMNPMFIEDYSQYINEPIDSIIKEIEEMKFIGISDFDLLPENIQKIEDEFEYMAIINGNGKIFELSYFTDDEKKYKNTFYGNYYSPFGYYPKDFKIIKVPKQKWAIFNADGNDKDIIISALKSYFYNEWLKYHKEYELDDNYEIAFECYNDEYLENNYPITRCEVWFPIKEKK
jgi:AraC family transcriptional regulator